MKGDLTSKLCSWLAIALVVFTLSCEERKSRENTMPFTVPQLSPDSIQSFGYKCGWIAIRTDDMQAVISALELKECRASSWEDGLQMAYQYPDGGVFVAPPVNGYVLCASFSLHEFPTGKNPDKITPILERLAKQFPDVQYFFTYRVVDAHAWARYTDGKCIRAFAVADGEKSWDVGELTPVEKSLDLEFPSEDDVMTVAEAWSVNPSEFEMKPVEVTQGIVGEL